MLFRQWFSFDNSEPKAKELADSFTKRTEAFISTDNRDKEAEDANSKNSTLGTIEFGHDFISLDHWQKKQQPYYYFSKSQIYY